VGMGGAAGLGGSTGSAGANAIGGNGGNGATGGSGGALGTPGYNGAGGLGAAGGTNGTPTLTNASVPLTMTYSGIVPVVYVSINGGPMAPVLVDTGSTGLVIPSQYVGTTGLGSSIYSGTAGYTGGLTYSYNTYTTRVDFGSGIVTAPTSIDIVSPSSTTAFQNYFAPSGAVGVLGIGPNNGFPGTSAIIPALPGTLNQGVLIDESQGVLVFGPNPLGNGLSVTGAPHTTVAVQINNGPLLSDVSASIDSGGVYGTMPASLLGTGQTSGRVPAGTMISVYTNDGQTLLYSYTTSSTNGPWVISSGVMNTGYIPFAQQPIYLSYSPTARGTTVLM
ncbi:MAG: PecA family PE domain-processing aspartic protease, partial [Mycobacteriaceae bacterium]|nr:PecA family PE domain-processing aspartic protease [Mycobacteriaceae bacterium]